MLWTQEWAADYTGLQLIYAIGPRATPTVDGDRVYVLGAMGRAPCARRPRRARSSGRRISSSDFAASVPSWGMSAAPLVDGDRLIALVGGEPNAKVIAFNKETGEEIWRALSSDWEPGYNQPIIIEARGIRQLIIWHPRGDQLARSRHREDLLGGPIRSRHGHDGCDTRAQRLAFARHLLLQRRADAEAG